MTATSTAPVCSPSYRGFVSPGNRFCTGPQKQTARISRKIIRLSMKILRFHSPALGTSMAVASTLA